MPGLLFLDKFPSTDMKWYKKLIYWEVMHHTMCLWYLSVIDDDHFFFTIFFMYELNTQAFSESIYDGN